MGEQVDIEYAAAEPADRADVVELLGACNLPTDDLPPSLDHFFLGRAGDQIMAVIGLEVLGGCALVRSLAVAPASRGQRVAHELWQLALGRARELNVGDLFLLTTTAEAIFAHWGFTRVSRDEAPEEIRRTEEFRTVCPVSAAFMRLALSDAHEFLRPSRRPSV